MKIRIFINIVISTICLITLLSTPASGQRLASVRDKLPASRRIHPLINHFSDDFNENSILQETGAMSSSPDQNWWLNSGAYFSRFEGIGATFQGTLPENDPWHKEYLNYDPVDTDYGDHPQNLFRLISKNIFHNFTQTVYFSITNDNLSSSSERYESNGILLLNRYIDENNLYYAGYRVDGNAVIKKKENGRYTTLGQIEIFPGAYDRATNPNLIPHNVWLGIRTEIVNDNNGRVDIKLYIDNNSGNGWQRILEVQDDSKSKITLPGHAGVRTDFMDVKFKNFSIFEK